MDQAVLQHWMDEKQKLPTDVAGRLRKLPMAIQTIEKPAEIWFQDTQILFLQLFKKQTGGKQGCVVYVTKDGKARTYFPKDVGRLNKARRGKKRLVLKK